MLVGPGPNPAGLKDTDDIYFMFNKIVTSGNADVTVSAKLVSLIASSPTSFALDSTRYECSSRDSVLVSIRQERHKY